MCSYGLVLLLLAASAEIGWGASRPAIQRPGIRQIVRDSALIFAGTVLAVQQDTDDANSPGTTSITFRVQEAVRGVHRGQTIKVREWAGLWRLGERYQPGEHVLYPASKLGLTSLVGGHAGRLQIDRRRRVSLNSGDENRPRRIDVKSFAAALRQSAKE